MDNKIQWLISLGLGLSLAACCGLRVFLPFLIAAVAAKLGWFHPTGSFSWISSDVAIACFGIASVLEIAGFMIPYFDHLLDVVAAPISMIAGAIMSASIFGMGDFLNSMPVAKVILGILVGGSAAGAIQAATSMTRVASTKLTGGAGNPIFAKIETILALILSLASFWIPLIAGSIVLVCICWVLFKIFGVFSRFINRS